MLTFFNQEVLFEIITTKLPQNLNENSENIVLNIIKKIVEHRQVYLLRFIAEYVFDLSFTHKWTTAREQLTKEGLKYDQTFPNLVKINEKLDINCEYLFNF